MPTSLIRLTALASAACLAALTTACSDESGDGGDSEPVAAQVEGVENFYGEYDTYVGVTAALSGGEITAEDLEHPWVAQQDHVDSADPEAVPEYDLTPPAGGDHLSQWQTCNGIAYGDPIVDGNAVHSMEHGAVWLTYDPELVDPQQVAALAEKITGRDYSLMSPYPGQGVAVSLQSWGNRYQTEDVADPNIDEYLDTYILNADFNPEPNATCAAGLTTTETDISGLTDDIMDDLNDDLEDMQDSLDELNEKTNE